MNFNNQWIVITGASSGLGRAMAHTLAREHSANLILVARREQRLQDLKQQLIADYTIQCEYICANLTNADDVQRIYNESITIAPVYAVILNAGITYFGKQQDIDHKLQNDMLTTNINSLVTLSNLFSEHIIANGVSKTNSNTQHNKTHNHGGIMYVASMGGLTPLPYQAMYAATKAFVVSFVASLQEEIADQPISLTTFAPGGIDTELTQNSKLKFFNNKLTMQSAQSCAKAGVHAFAQRKKMYVPRTINQFQALLFKLLPQKIFVKTVATAYRKALQTNG